ncbi:MAG: MFS transporter [Myxococcales bacterium]|nr:MFS transporter [Myxococcales bacterium]
MLAALSFSAFLAFGVLLVLVGANQADLARDLDLDLARSGLLVSALALGIGIGVVGAGPIFDRHARRPLFVAAALLVAIPLLAVDASIGFGRALVHLLLAGVGAGAYDTLISAMVVERYRERAAKPMSAVHAAATLGAVLGPFAAGWLAARHHWAASFQWTGAAHLALAGAALFTRFPAPAPLRRTGDGVLSAALLPFAWIAFAYVGVEAAMTAFAMPYATEAAQLAAARGRTAISAFWFGLFAGRVAVLALRGAPGAGLLLAAGTAGGTAIAVGIGLAGSAVEIVFGAVGLALGSVFPLVITLTGQRFPHARGTAAGLAAGAGALGGFCIPWLTGAIGDRVGVVAAVASLALWSLTVAGAAAILLRWSGPRPSRS